MLLLSPYGSWHNAWHMSMQQLLVELTEREAKGERSQKGRDIKMTERKWRKYYVSQGPKEICVSLFMLQRETQGFRIKWLSWGTETVVTQLSPRCRALCPFQVSVQLCEALWGLQKIKEKCIYRLLSLQCREKALNWSLIPISAI